MGNKYLFVAIDKLTKRVETLVTIQIISKVNAKFLLNNIIFRHSLQKFLKDNGLNFTAKIIPKLNK